MAYHEKIILKDLINLMQTGKFIVHIRRAFGDHDYYDGDICDIPKDFPYLNRTVCAIYPWNYDNGDVNWENCTALDIAIGDFDYEDLKNMEMNSYE